MMKPDPMDVYALALGTGDRYTAQLAATINGVSEDLERDHESELVIEEPDF